MKNYYDNLLGLESILPFEIIQLLNNYKTEEDQNNDKQSTNTEKLILDEHELAIIG